MFLIRVFYNKTISLAKICNKNLVLKRQKIICTCQLIASKFETAICIL
jgi:hypothetical protein